MRCGVAAIGTLLLGCNALLGIHDLSPDASSDDASTTCSGGCACAIDTDCAAHMYCDVEATSSACLCVAGYTETSGACTWTGVVTNPGFTMTTGWMLGSDTTIDPTYTATGLLDPGIASTLLPQMQGLPGFAITTGEVSQTFVMPRLSRAEPLVIEIRDAIVNSSPFTFTTSASGLDVGAGWDENAVGLPTSFATSRVCLGASQYAPETSSGSGMPSGLDLITAVTTQSMNGPPMPGSAAFDDDHVEIVEAGSDECPAPGTVINGDASGSDGWTFHTYPNAANDGASAGFTPTGGANGSPGVELSLVQSCDEVTASVPASVALPGASGAALSLYHHKTGGTLTISFGNQTLALGGETTGTIDRYCVPAPMQGVVTSLFADFYTDGTCGSAAADKADLDSVEVAPAPECALGSGVVDGGFEAEASAGYQLTNISKTASGDSVGTVDDGSAPEGMRYLKLSTAETCDDVEWLAFVVTPPAQAGAAPALTFSYKSSAAGLTVGGKALAKSGWAQATICLDATVKPGRGQLVTFDLYDDSSNTCGAASTLVAGIDALAVTTDPSCAP
jgi:hypothetical protein